MHFYSVRFAVNFRFRLVSINFTVAIHERIEGDKTDLVVKKTEFSDKFANEGWSNKSIRPLGVASAHK